MHRYPLYGTSSFLDTYSLDSDLLVDRGVQFLSELDPSLRSMAVLFGRANKLSDCRASAEEPWWDWGRKNTNPGRRRADEK